MKLTRSTVPQMSPVEARLKELPRGNGDWPGYAYVWNKLQQACHAMAKTRYVHLSDEHVNAMAILGSGHEELMKYELMRCRDRGFV